MYSFLEIAIIFKNCSSPEECKRARAVFAMVFQDQDLSINQLFFVRKRQKIREWELKG